MIVLGAACGFYAALLALSRLEAGTYKINEKKNPLKPITTVEEIKSLKNKKEFVQLFLQSQAPSFDMLEGYTFEAELLPLGILSPIAGFIANHLLGPGKWIGKKFNIMDNRNIGDTGALGTNIFTSIKNKNKANEAVDFEYSVQMSDIDSNPSLLLSYGKRNKWNIIAWGISDELRTLDRSGNILIGCGGMIISGGMNNFAPFILYRKDKIKTK